MRDKGLSRLGAWVLAALLGFAGLAQAAGPDPTAAGLAQLIRPLMAPASPYASPPGWEGVEASRVIRWGAGPQMMNKPSPDGNYFARPGLATIAGRPVQVIASGARSMVFSLYMRDPGAPADPDALAAGLRQSGYGVSLARCAINPGGAARRQWFRLTAPQKNPVFLAVGPLQSGGGGYTLYLTELPAMTQAEAQAYTDDCAARRDGAASGAGVSGPRRNMMGQDGVVAFLEALLRPAGAAPALPWAEVGSLPVVRWKAAAPTNMSNPWTDSGEDRNPKLLEGEFRTATTRMLAVATGDGRGANRFYLRDGGNLPQGGVFAMLARDGYAITPLRCGKVYTETSQAWHRISGPGKQPAILYRAQHNTDGVRSEDYGLWLDNILPPAQPGQSAPVGGRCP